MSFREKVLVGGVLLGLALWAVLLILDAKIMSGKFGSNTIAGYRAGESITTNSYAILLGDGVDVKGGAPYQFAFRANNEVYRTIMTPEEYAAISSAVRRAAAAKGQSSVPPMSRKGAM